MTNYLELLLRHAAEINDGAHNTVSPPEVEVEGDSYGTADADAKATTAVSKGAVGVVGGANNAVEPDPDGIAIAERYRTAGGDAHGVTRVAATKRTHGSLGRDAAASRNGTAVAYTTPANRYAAVGGGGTGRVAPRAPRVATDAVTPAVPLRVAATRAAGVAAAAATNPAAAQASAALRRAMWLDSGAVRLAHATASADTSRLPRGYTPSDTRHAAAPAPVYPAHHAPVDSSDSPTVGELSLAIERDARRYG